MITQKKTRLKPVERIFNLGNKQKSVELRLDRNENTAFWTQNEIQDIKELMSEKMFCRYPDDQNVINAMSKIFGVNTKNITICHGANGGIKQILEWLTMPDDLIFGIEPSYIIYQVFGGLYRCNFKGYSLNPDLSLDIDLLINSLRNNKPRIFFLANPDQPSGQQLSPDNLVKLFNACQENNTTLVIDQPYVEFADYNPMDDIGIVPGIVYIRSLSKSAGMAGLRLGSIIADEETTQLFVYSRAPAEINNFTALVCEYLAERPGLIDNRCEKIINLRKKTVLTFKESGFETIDTSTNFFHIRLKTSEHANKFKKGIDKRGLKVRGPFNYPLDSVLRITIGTKEEMSKAIKICKDEYSDAAYLNS